MKKIIHAFDNLKISTKILMLLLLVGIGYAIAVLSKLPAIKETSSSTQTILEDNYKYNMEIVGVVDAINAYRFDVFRHVAALNPKELDEGIQKLQATEKNIKDSLASIKDKITDDDFIVATDAFFKSSAKTLEQSKMYAKEVARQTFNTVNDADFQKIIQKANDIKKSNWKKWKESISFANVLMDSSLFEIVATFMGVFLVIQFIGWIISRRITRPIMEIVKTGQKIENNEDNVQIPSLDRKDEVGYFAHTLSSIKEKLVDAMRAQSAIHFASGAMIIFDEKGDLLEGNKSSINLIKKYNVYFQQKFQIRLNTNQETSNSFNVSVFNSAVCTDIHTLKEPLSKTIQSDDIALLITINPIYDLYKKTIGYIVELADMTEETLVQNEVQNLVYQSIAGDFSNRIDTSSKTGFMKQLSDGINSLMDTIQTSLNEIDIVLKKLSEGDLTQNLNKNYKGFLNEIKQHINSALRKFLETVSNISETSYFVKDGVDQISTDIQMLSKTSAQQSQKLQAASGDMTSILEMVKDNTNSAYHAKQLASSTLEVANEGATTVTKAKEAMDSIKESSNKITDIIDVINEISFQTNLLALNASVEAARAGDAGKGFAVVAEEVRTLSQKTAESSKQISEIIRESGDKVNEGVELVHQVSDVLTKLAVETKKVETLVDTIAVASQEQASAIDSIHVVISEADSIASNNQEQVTKNTEIAEELYSRSSKMNELVNFFKISSTNESQETYRLQ